LARAVEAAHHRAFANPEGPGCFLVREARHVDRNQDVAEVVRKRRDRGVHLRRLERGLGLTRPRIGDEVELVGQRDGTKSAALSPLLVQEGVPQRAQEVAEVVLVTEKPGAREHTAVGFLDKVLRVLARAGERPRGPVEPVEVVSEPGSVERTFDRARISLRRMQPIRSLALVTVGALAGALAGVMAAAAFVKRAVPSRGDAESDEVTLVAVYDGVQLKSRAKAFTGGSILAWYGGVEVDLTEATIAPQAHLTVHALFGGVAIRVPPGCRIGSSMHAVMGGVDASGSESDSPDAPTLTLDGLAVFGGIAVGSKREADQGGTEPIGDS
jgi:hypothetical protein